MPTSNLFIIIGCLLSFFSPFLYLRSIFRGDAQPHRTTRLVLLINTTLMFLALLAQHDQVAVWLAAVGAFQTAIVFIFSIKFGMGGWSKMDINCLILSLLGIFMWKVTENPVTGLYFAMFSDFMGMAPTLLKTFLHPKTEVWNFWLLDTLAAGLNILALQSWTTIELSYPLYILLINLAMVLLVIRPTAYPFLSSRKPCILGIYKP